MEKRRILMRNAVNLDAELSRHFTHVKIVEPLVMEAILAVDLRSNTLAILSEDIGLVRKFVNVIHVCRRSRQVDHDDWGDIGDRVLNF